MQKKFKPYRDGTSSSSDDDEISSLKKIVPPQVMLAFERVRISLVCHILCGGIFV